MAADLRDDGIGLRIVPLFPTPAKLARIRQILGASAILRESSAASPVAAPEEDLRHALPRASCSSRSGSALLARNERLLSRLQVCR